MPDLLHSIALGIIIGIGAAVPIGPVNLEIIRRNLALGLMPGVYFGLGACSADLTYLALLALGAIQLLHHPWLLNTTSLLGAAILVYFAWSSFSSHSNDTVSSQPVDVDPASPQFLSGYLMTLLNPYTILFWASISSQLVNLHAEGLTSHTLTTGIGVIIGTVGWALSLNLIVHNIRHYFSVTVMKYLNITGGVLLLGFAALSVWVSIHSLLSALS